jgi:decaprenylphospho-beta-D-erythro-pentofuranosid-2-ulose 2-reductase
MKKILIVGATSAIAQHAGRLWASRNAEFFLVGRDEHRLAAVADDLRVRGAKLVETCVSDVNDFHAHSGMVHRAVEALQTIEVALIAHGSLPNQKQCEGSFDKTLDALCTNCLSVVSLLTHFASYFEQQGSGTIAVISSVAGDRGRKDNYVYGAAKGMVTIFLQGLRNRLHRSGVQVLTIKPGLVDTPMTAEFQKGFLWAEPNAVGQCIVKAIEQRKDTVYIPWFWRPTMALIRAVPESVFKKLDLAQARKAEPRTS